MTEKEKMYQNRPYLDDNELRQQYYISRRTIYYVSLFYIIFTCDKRKYWVWKYGTGA